MPIKAHTHNMLRVCGATTVVEGQSDVYVGGQLWAVEGDPNTDKGGALIASVTDVWINGKLVIVDKPDKAGGDRLGFPPHDQPDTSQGFDDVTVY